MICGPSLAMHANVLALNRLFVAIQVVSVRRAFGLLFKGRAEVISVENGLFLSHDFESWLDASLAKTELSLREESEDWVASVNYEIEVPRVIRLLHFDRIPRNGVKFNRRNVFLRDGNLCQYCGKRFSNQSLSLDHVIPRSRGGMTTWDNVVSACLRCNVKKGSRTPQEAGMKLRSKPVKPKRNPVLAQQLGSHKYATWKTFLD